MNIDHVILGTRTIAPLREWLRDGHGLGITDGSPNPDGTASWVVPMDTERVQYLELLVVNDESELAATEFGRTFLERTADDPAFLNWAVLSDDIDADAGRVEQLTGQDPELFRGKSVRSDGQEVPWAEAAFAASWNTPSLPFFLQYENWPARRARVPGDIAAAAHDHCPTGIIDLAVDVQRADLSAWLGGARLPLTVRTSSADAVRAVTVATASGSRALELP
ncbi:VOC family protein [Streptomyces parvus]|uniref:VOC family protein n=1 Tax=Streptomyces parvus TaxID=66428 RepID=A0A5D4JET5_9ACTN|nr:VOC family protein [Streptomyces parvus]TYR62719.1 VOC family protein [Streptomyces parvus]